MTDHPGHSAPLPPRDAQTDSKRLRILIVEDHADTAHSLAMLLDLHGHETCVAIDGPTALGCIESAKPDVVLLDIGLPGMDGWEVARRIREHSGPKTPLLIAVSGYGDEPSLNRSRAEGIHLHLIKPVDPIELQTLLLRFRTLLCG
jgi:CheY-like chemotaxis protein